MNVIKAKVDKDKLTIMDQPIALNPALDKVLKSYAKSEVYLGIRPEHIDINRPNGLLVKINYLEDYGNRLGIYFDLLGQEYAVITDSNNYQAFKEEGSLQVTFQPQRICLFDIDTEENLEA